MKIAINGFGRIGRLVYRIMEEDSFFDVVAINDLSSSEELAYLLKYDTNFRRYEKEVSFDEEGIIVDGKKAKVFKETEPENLPWKELGIDLVFECTGRFTKVEDAYKHIKAGAKKVLVSAPCKGDAKTIVYNVNEDILDGTEEVISAASCTTNCLAPVLKVINDTFGIERGFMTTVHAYTNGKVIPSLDGKLSGGALRVPVSDGSLVDLTLELTEKVTVDELNSAFMNNVNETLEVTTDPIVSSDIIGSRCGSLVDLSLTKVVEADGKQLVKVIAWYDNEMGYSAQMVRTAKCVLKG